MDKKRIEALKKLLSALPEDKLLAALRGMRDEPEKKSHPFTRATPAGDPKR